MVDRLQKRNIAVQLSILIASGWLVHQLIQFRHVKAMARRDSVHPTDGPVQAEAVPDTPWQRILKHQNVLDSENEGKNAPQQCNHLYGIDHVRDYRNFLPLCEGPAGKEDTLVRCASFSSTHPFAEHDKHKEATCEGLNLVVNGSAVQKWSDVLEDRHRTKKGGGQPMPPRGLLSGRCKEVGPGVTRGTEGSGGQKFLRSTFQAYNGSGLERGRDRPQLDHTRLHRKIGPMELNMEPTMKSMGKNVQFECEGIVEHAVYVVAEPWGYMNLWHGFEEITSMFVAYAVYNLDPADAQVLVADGRAGSNMTNNFGVHGPLVDSFSRKAPPLSLVDAMRQIAPQGGNACFKRIIFSTWGQPSIQAAGSYHNMARIRLSAPYKCGPSSIFLGLRDHILENLGQPRAAADPTSLRILWLERSTRLTGHESAILELIETAALRHGASVIRQDLSLLGYMEQIQLVQTVSVLIGIHGAAFTWGFLLPQGGSIIEISRESLGARCYCYVTAANSVGASHTSVLFRSNSNTERERLMKTVDTALANLKENRPDKESIQEHH